MIRLGGVSRFSTVDWPGRLAAVLFVQGCPWRCGYCHNPGLQTRDAAGIPWEEVLAWLPGRVGLLDGVVFSGGEPLLDGALPNTVRQVKAMGFATGLHTAGIYPDRLAAVLPLMDWVGLDVKAPLDGSGHYQRITGSFAAGRQTGASLALVQAAHEARGLDYECRTTWHPSLFEDGALLRLSGQLRDAGVRRWILQMARPTPQWRPEEQGAVLPEAVKNQLRREWPELEIRAAA